MLKLANLVVLSAMVQHFLFTFLAINLQYASSFPQNIHCKHASQRATKIFGVSEWRDLPVDPELFHRLGRNGETDKLGDGVARRLPVLLVESKKVALFGETHYYQWTRDDDVRLFQQAIDRNEGVFGLGFIHDRCQGKEGKEVLLDKIALMQIEDFNMMGQEFGIFCSAKVVGRASILQIEEVVSEDDPLTVISNEFFDRREGISLAEANILARNVLELVMKISNADELQLPTTATAIVDSDENSEKRLPTSIDRFRVAYEAAIHADNQGYYLSSCDRSSNTGKTLLSWSEINAISWAAFATNESLEMDKTYRLQAMDYELITNRLQFANFWFSDILVETTR